MTKNVHTALAKAQSEMGQALKDSTNPHFRSKYADLSSVLAACRTALNNNGICVFHNFVETETQRSMTTVFAHGESDTQIEIPVPIILGKQDMQGLGSAMTYARRYGIMALAGIAPEDDDGNAAAQSAPSKTQQGIGDAWKDSVLDSIPADATRAQKATAFADAICRDMQGKTGIRALNNEWDRRKAIIAELEQHFPDLHTKVVDAFELRQMDLSDSQDIAAQ